MEKRNNTFGPKYAFQVIATLLLIVFIILLIFIWGFWEPENSGNESLPIATQRALTNEAIENLLIETPVP